LSLPLLIYIIIKKKYERSQWEVGKKVGEAVKRVKHVSEVVFG
jgi:hypothetical protein